VGRTDSGGSSYGVCQFPNGSECEEWAFYRGQCVKGEVYPSSGAKSVSMSVHLQALDPSQSIDSESSVEAQEPSQSIDSESSVEAQEPSRLLNYGIVMGVGALAGFIAVSQKSKKGTNRLLGAGVGAGVGALLLAMTWPKTGA
jgi:hypothetical protein